MQRLARRPLASHWYPADMLLAKLRREGRVDARFFGPLFFQDRRRWGSSIPLAFVGKYSGDYLTCLFGSAGLPWARSKIAPRDAIIWSLGALVGFVL